MHTDAMTQSGKAGTQTSDRLWAITREASITRPALVGALTALAAIVAIALPASALAQTTTTETGSGYSATPTLSTSTSTSATATGTAHHTTKRTGEGSTGQPAKEKAKHARKPKTERKPPAVKPASKAAVSKPATTRSLPFTGLNLIWVIGGGLLLLGAGVTIRIAQRRHG